MPETARSSRGQWQNASSETIRPVLDRRGPRHALSDEDKREADASKHDADVYVAKWIDAAITAWGKATAFAEAIEVDLAHVTRMRSGEKPTPIRALLPLLGNPEAVLAFVGPLLESIEYVARPVAGPTFTQLSAAVLADLDDGSAVTRQLIENAARKRGWTAAQVEMALHREGETK